MDLRELESYRLSDAVKFNDSLNPVLWGSDERLRPEVRDALLKIAEDFKEFLGINVEVKDITISGSNAAYTYTPHSDIDLHLVVDLPKADQSDVYRELFDAKKYAYNDQHDFKIGGYDVELYVQNANQPHHSQGIYSVTNDEWLRVPNRRKPEVNDISVRSKYEDIGRRVEAAIDSGDLSQMDSMARKIKDMRQAGLDQHGEFGPENLAFKILRGNGTLDRLRQARLTAKDSQMSLEERRKKKSKKKRFAYGNFGGYYYPGYHYYGQTDAVGDGGGDGGGESVKESVESRDIKDVVKMFAGFAAKYLKLKKTPKIKLRRDPEWSNRNGTFGRYMPEDDALILSIANRHPVDVMRTLAHEFVHHRQNEIETMPDHAGETGSEWEDEANAIAGRIMRDFAEAHPGYFDADQVEEGWREKAAGVAAAACIAGTPGCATMGTDAGRVARDIQTIGRTAQSIERMGKHGARDEIIQRMRDELRRGTGKTGVNEASGYIPTEKERNDPRYSMALTVDIKPGQLGKEANKLGLQTDSQGHPQLLMKNLKNALEEFKKTGIYESVKPVVPPVRPTTARTQYPPVPKQKTNVPQDKPRERPDGTGKIIDYEIKEDFNAGDVIDLTPNYSAFNTLHGEILGTGTDGKLRIKIIRAEPANKKIAPGAVIKVAPNYVRRNTVVTEDEDLFEVKMSPSSLESWARSSEAEGVRAGFEAEMIFRDTSRDEDEGEMEPDYDYDERPDGIDEVIEFFSNDDWGYGLSSRGARSLREELFNEFVEWSDEQISESWDNEAEDQVRDYMESNVWGDDEEREKRIQDKIDEMFPNDDSQAILAAGEAAPRFTRSSDQTAYTEQNDLYAKYKEASDAAYEEFEEEVTNEVESQGEYYDQARENYFDMMRDDGDYDERGFLRDRYGYMSEIASNFSLDWPYMMGGSSGSGGRSWEEIGDSLQRAVGMPVKVGSGYHSVARTDNRWIIEPDGSLDPDDYDDAGLEIVSPPMPLPVALEKLKQVIEWGNNTADAYTNSSTGLHMGVSIPYVGGDVDYVKLVLFMGDEYVLDKFGRASNTYAASAMGKLRQNIAGARNRGELTEARVDPMGALELIQKNLIELAQRYIQGGVGQSKYTSAHIKDGYIEFRSPGGDYLAMESRGEFDEIKNTMLRFARAMYIAGRPDLERLEYAKKLYKLVSPGAQDDALKLFSEYSAGTIDKDQLKNKWAEAVLQAQQPKPKAVTQWEVYRDDHGQDERLEIVDAGSRGEAVDAVYDKYTGVIPFKVRPYSGEPEPASKLSRRAEIAKRIKEPKVTPAVAADNAQDSQRLQARVDDTNVRDMDVDVAQNFQPSGQTFTGSWQVLDSDTNDVLYTFSGIGNNQADANRVAARWLQQNAPQGADMTDVTVVPVMR